ncbi:MAG: hypothetical protein ACRDJ9_24980, partial [Dehalococcoidia bacterium]
VCGLKAAYWITLWGYVEHKVSRTYANYWRLERGGRRIRPALARLVAALLAAQELRARTDPRPTEREPA